MFMRLQCHAENFSLRAGLGVLFLAQQVGQVRNYLAKLGKMIGIYRPEKLCQLVIVYKRHAGQRVESSKHDGRFCIIKINNSNRNLGLVCKIGSKVPVEKFKPIRGLPRN